MPIYKRNRNNKTTYYARINYTDSEGKSHTKCSKDFKTKNEAKIAEVQLSLGIKETGSKYTFATIYAEYEEYQKKQVKTSTARKYKSEYDHIEPLWNVEINKLTATQYVAFKNELDKSDLKLSTKNRVHKFVKQLIHFACKMHNVSSNIPDKVGPFVDANAQKQEMQFFTLDEFQQYIKYFDNDLIYRTFFKTLFYLGLRLGEANGLTWECFDNNKIKIKATVSTKIKGEVFTLTSPKTLSSNRILPLTNDLVEEFKMLKEYYSKMDGFNETWFVFGGIRPLSETTITNKKNLACDNQNVKRIRIHDFRHSCASYYINKGATPILVAKLLGHSDIKMTLNTYSHLWPNELDNLING